MPNIDKVFHTGYTYRIEYSSTQNPETNKSTVVCNHKLICKPYYDLDIGARNNSCSVGSDTKNFTSPAINTSGNSTINLGTTTHTVQHDEEGKATVTISGTFNPRAYLSGIYYGEITASATVELPQILRADIATATDFDIGSAIMVQVTRYNPKYTRTVVAKIGNYTETLIEKGTDTSIIKVLNASSLYAQIPNSNVGDIILTTTTYDGDTVIGQQDSQPVKCRVTNSNPVVNSVVISDADAVVASDVIVRYLSNVKVTIDASSKNSATLKSYIASTPTVTKSSSNNVVTLGSVNENKFTVQVVDSRQNSSDKKELTASKYVPYILPAISEIELTRIGETLDQIEAVVKGQWYSSAINGTANTLRIRYRTKLTTSNTWSEYIYVSHNITGDRINLTTTIAIAGGFDTNALYDVEFSVVDNLTSGLLETVLPKAIPLTDHWEDDSGAHYNINAELQQFGSPVALKSSMSGYRYATNMMRNTKLYLGKCLKDYTGTLMGALTLYISNLDIYDFNCPGILHWFKQTGAKFTLFDEIRHSAARKYLNIWTDGTYLYLFLSGGNYHDYWNVDVLSSRGFSDMTGAVLSQAEYDEFVKDMTYVADYNPVDDTDKSILYSTNVEMKAGDSISLPQSVDNYKEIEIICYRGNDYGSSSVKISPSLNKAPTLVLTYTDDTRIMQLVVKFLFSGSTLTCTSSNRYVTDSSGLSISAENTFSLAKIIGYK